MLTPIGGGLGQVSAHGAGVFDPTDFLIGLESDGSAYFKQTLANFFNGLNLGANPIDITSADGITLTGNGLNLNSDQGMRFTIGSGEEFNWRDGALAANNRARMTATEFELANYLSLAWSATNDATDSPDTSIQRQAANLLRLGHPSDSSKAIDIGDDGTYNIIRGNGNRHLVFAANGVPKFYVSQAAGSYFSQFNDNVALADDDAGDSGLRLEGAGSVKWSGASTWYQGGQDTGIWRNAAGLTEIGSPSVAASRFAIGHDGSTGLVYSKNGGLYLGASNTSGRRLQLREDYLAIFEQTTVMARPPGYDVMWELTAGATRRLRGTSDFYLAWSPTTTSAQDGQDTYFGRNAAGLLEIGSPTTSANRLIAGNNGSESRLYSGAGNLVLQAPTSPGQIAIRQAAGTPGDDELWIGFGTVPGGIVPQPTLRGVNGGVILRRRDWYMEHSDGAEAWSDAAESNRTKVIIGRSPYSGVQLSNDWGFSWNSAIGISGGPDTGLWRNAAGLIEAGSASDANDRSIWGHNGTNGIGQAKSGNLIFSAPSGEVKFLGYSRWRNAADSNTVFLCDGDAGILYNYSFIYNGDTSGNSGQQRFWGSNSCISFFNVGGSENSRIQGNLADGVIAIVGNNGGVGGTLSFYPYAPAQITSTQNNYASVHGRSLHVHLSSDAARTINGITAGLDGETHIVTNVGSYNITFAHQSGSATGAQISTENQWDHVLAPYARALLTYDATLGDWRLAPFGGSREIMWGSGTTIRSTAYGGSTMFSISSEEWNFNNTCKFTYLYCHGPNGLSFSVLEDAAKLWADATYTGSGQNHTLVHGTVASASVGSCDAYPPYSPAQITSNQTNYAIKDRSKYLRLTTDAAREIQGIGAGVNGEEHVIINVGSFDLSIMHLHASATGKQIRCDGATDLVLGTDDWCTLVYDSTSDVWRAKA